MEYINISLEDIFVLLNGYLNNSSPDFPKAFGKVRQIQEAITYLKNDLQIAANLFQDKIYIDEDF